MILATDVSTVEITPE